MASFMKKVVSKLVWYLVYGIFLLPVTIAYASAKWKLARRIKRLLSLPQSAAPAASSPTDVASIADGSRAMAVRSCPTDESVDFLLNRANVYLHQRTFGCLRELSDLAAGRQRVPLISDHALRYALLNTSLSRGLARGDPKSELEWSYEFTDIAHYKLREGRYWDVREIQLRRGYKLLIVDRAGVVHTQNSATWSLAKAHAQSQLTFCACADHADAHLVFPGLVAWQARQVLARGSVLRQLIDPHTRFTRHVNLEVLENCTSTSGGPTRPWFELPISNPGELVTAAARSCDTFFYTRGNLVRALDDDIPYHYYLRVYYDVIADYVTSLEPLIADDCLLLVAACGAHLPCLLRHRPVDVIAALIWHCSIVHSADHDSFYHGYAKKYGCMAIRTPLVSTYDNHAVCIDVDTNIVTKRDDQVVVTSSMTSSPQQRARGDMFRAVDVYRTRCFMRQFVVFTPTPGLDLSTLGTEYGFTDENAIALTRDFRQRMIDLDSLLRQRSEAIVPLSRCVRSVCF